MSEQKKRLSLILLLFILGVIFISGCGIVEKAVTQQAGAQQTAPTTTQPTTGKSGISRDVELEVCAGMPQVGEVPLDSFCYIGLAAKYKDTALCQKMTSDVRRSCYNVIAIASNNPAICEEAGSNKDQCYSEYSRQAKDASACEKIVDVYQKDSCYSNAANTLADASYCDKVRVVPNKDNCYQNMAMRLQDKSFCDKITTANIKDSCNQNLGRY